MSDSINSLISAPTPEEMRLWDKNAIEFGIPEEMLMENAAKACARLLDDLEFTPTDKSIWLFMGNGNNGGDAAALARDLFDRGMQTFVFHFADLHTLKESCGFHAKLACKDGVKFIQLKSLDNPFMPAAALFSKILSFGNYKPGIIIDGLIGTGFSGSLRTGVENLINAINQLSEYLSVPIFSIDAPSGLNCITGNPQPSSIKAAITLTLAAPKPGLLLPHAKEWTGRLFCRSIGFPQAMDKPAKMKLLDGHYLVEHSPQPENSYKNTFGHIFVFGGSSHMTGAPRLSALAALRSGAGLVTIASSQAVIKDANIFYPEFMTETVEKEQDWPSEINQELKLKCQKADALIIGPGMGRSENAKSFLEVFLKIDKRPPTVFDADSLYILGKNQELLKFVRETDILTPHPGEAGFLLQSSASEIQNNRMEALKELISCCSGIIVLKGAATIIGQKNKIFLMCPYDIPQLAIAGSGDVLSGCIAGMICRPQMKNDIYASVARGVVTHAMAGFLCSKRFPARGALAADLANAIPQVFNFIKNEKIGIYGEIPWPV